MKNKPFRVLSLDGGGIRGLYTASILQRLLNRYGDGNKDLGRGFDLIAGTSTGGILAMALASGVPVAKIIQLYKEAGPRIFTKPAPDTLWAKIRWATTSIGKPANCNSVLKSELKQIFHEQTIKDLWDERGIGLCLTSVNLTTHRAQVFKTPHIENKNADNSRKLVDICLATSAAPIILPIGQSNDPDDPDRKEYHVDGGLWANNPILVALTEAMQLSETSQDIEIISVGTCQNSTGNILDPKKENGGLAYWNFGIKPLSISLEAQSHGYLHIAKFLADSLTKHGKNCKVLRLYESSPSAEQSKHLGLDKANAQSIKVLLDLASEDARIINGHINNNNGNYKIIDDIFTNLKDLPNKEGNHARSSE